MFSIGWLALFKYAAFFITNLNALTGLGLTVPTLTLPLGISFYTFQIMTYTVDVYAGKVQTERSLINFGTFVVLFPQLIAGPIVKYSDISRELHERKITLAQIQDCLLYTSGVPFLPLSLFLSLSLSLTLSLSLVDECRTNVRPIVLSQL